MILSNQEIFEALDDGRLVLNPEPTPRFATLEGPASPFNRSSVDLQLDGSLQVPRPDVGVIIDPRRGSTPMTLATLYDSREIPAEGFNLEPGRFLLGNTIERVKLVLPEDLDAHVRAKGCLAARVEGRSSLARFGLLVHFTAPTIHAGFEGTITLEIMNLGPAPITLTTGLPICQLILEQVLGEPLAYPGRFQGQSTATGHQGRP